MGYLLVEKLLSAIFEFSLGIPYGHGCLDTEWLNYVDVASLKDEVIKVGDFCVEVPVFLFFVFVEEDVGGILLVYVAIGLGSPAQALDELSSLVLIVLKDLGRVELVGVVVRF